ncbi:hypothetical protein LOK49_LG01G01394 [Camellia lanceoleosa]|uniref:Uncharacterized protein n=1 Tax=Camellia lanceoleosa TaxID=1840588 RepID=A0ACC0J521_9ERIC|nr:hypothetical protein LOK49_LG01G01394 [Camellia lanceoleosa]
MECGQYCWGRVFLMVIVFRGLSLITPKQHSLKKPSACNADIVVSKKLLIFEVVSFSFFLFSSLVTVGLRLAINLLNSKDADEAFWVNQWSYAIFWKIGCQNPKYVFTQYFCFLIYYVNMNLFYC